MAGGEGEAPEHDGHHRRLRAAGGEGEQAAGGEVPGVAVLQPPLQADGETGQEDQPAHCRGTPEDPRRQVAVERSGREPEKRTRVGVEESDARPDGPRSPVPEEDASRVRQLEPEKGHPERGRQREERVEKRRPGPVGRLDREGVGQEVVVQRHARHPGVLERPAVPQLSCRSGVEEQVEGDRLSEAPRGGEGLEEDGTEDDGQREDRRGRRRLDRGAPGASSEGEAQTARWRRRRAWAARGRRARGRPAGRAPGSPGRASPPGPGRARGRGATRGGPRGRAARRGPRPGRERSPRRPPP